MVKRKQGKSLLHDADNFKKSLQIFYFIAFVKSLMVHVLLTTYYFYLQITSDNSVLIV